MSGENPTAIDAMNDECVSLRDVAEIVRSMLELHDPDQGLKVEYVDHGAYDGALLMRMSDGSEWLVRVEPL